QHHGRPVAARQFRQADRVEQRAVQHDSLGAGRQHHGEQGGRDHRDQQAQPIVGRVEQRTGDGDERGQRRRPARLPVPATPPGRGAARPPHGRLVVRCSTQVPFLVRDELCQIFGLRKDRVRVFATRVGGGFGAKQEMLAEDLIALAVLRTGRPVQYEFTRGDEFTAATCRHPMRVAVTAGAGTDGVLTALTVDVLADGGAYGNHSAGVMFHGVGESIGVYRCANKRVDAQAVYTNNIPSGAFRGYGLGQVIFGIESALDDLARALGMDPFEFRRRNVVRPGDAFVGAEVDESDLTFGSYGLDQCIDLAERALLRGGRLWAPRAEGGGGAPPGGGEIRR
ncbi:xanthine dehydrogenase family protein molybdopterin-binding subunit, partial [Nocardia brasiliensis]|uniref:xanthine dehydrogenase family protein molybdopterin-binding subunit n=1 Tax=Nocardia brasiliensis TaxID=37326 RepID=UPI003D7A8C2F